MTEPTMPTEGARLLLAYLLERQITQKQAAIAIGVSGPTIHDWTHGKKRPRGPLRKRIARWTRGGVPVAAWLSEKERAAIASAREAA